jgi:CRISPR-associated protein Cas6
MAYVELHFPVLGEMLPTDHGYALYAGLSSLIPALHVADSPVAVGPILGEAAGGGILRLGTRGGRLRLRLPVDQVPAFLPLAGKSLEVGDHRIRLGVPQVRPLVPAPSLAARLVVVKGFTEPGPFLGACRRQLDSLGVAGEVGIPLARRGGPEGEPRRRVLRVKDRRVVGFAVQVTGLTAEESLRVQERGIGGRRRMGCGFFLPLVPRGA